MDVLVTGSEGLIGRQVVSELERRGHRPIGFDIVHNQDVANEGQLLAALAQVDAVIHLAAPSSPLLFDSRPDFCWEQTVNSVNTIIQAFTGRIVCPSSGKVYGSIPVRGHEDMTLPPSATRYAAAKLEVERMCFQAISERGRDIKICRVFACYGGDESHKYRTGNDVRYASTPYTFVRHALEGETLDLYRSGEQQRDFLHVEDAGRGLVDVLLTCSDKHVFNLGTGRPIRFRDLVEIVNATTGEPLTVKVQEDAPPGYSDYMVADTGRASQELGWTARITLEDGLARVVAAMRAAGDLSG